MNTRVHWGPFDPIKEWGRTACGKPTVRRIVAFLAGSELTAKDVTCKECLLAMAADTHVCGGKS